MNRRVDFSGRSSCAERMDEEDLPADELFDVLNELRILNRWLFGYVPTIKGLSTLLNNEKATGGAPLRVLDVGSGGGDVTERILTWLDQQGIDARVEGIDLLPDAVRYAREHHGGDERIQFSCRELEEIGPGESYDLVHSSLVLHHFPGEKAVEAVRKMVELSRVGIIINDLQRHPVSYYFIRWLTKLLSGSDMIKHDAPLSVLRSFTREELETICRRAGLPEPQISWHHGFRWSVTARSS